MWKNDQGVLWESMLEHFFFAVLILWCQINLIVFWTKEKQKEEWINKYNKCSTDALKAHRYIYPIYISSQIAICGISHFIALSIDVLV